MYKVRSRRRVWAIYPLRFARKRMYLFNKKKTQCKVPVWHDLSQSTAREPRSLRCDMFLHLQLFLTRIHKFRIKRTLDCSDEPQ